MWLANRICDFLAVKKLIIDYCFCFVREQRAIIRVTSCWSIQSCAFNEPKASLDAAKLGAKHKKPQRRDDASALWFLLNSFLLKPGDGILDDIAMTLKGGTPTNKV